jgi:hypothetical protein
MSFHWKLGQLCDLGSLIASLEMDRVITIGLNTTQVTQIASLPETKTKNIFDIGCNNLGPNMAIILSIHALHLQ